MSHILELLGRGVDSDLSDLLDRYFWAPSDESIEQLTAACEARPNRPEQLLKLGLAHLRAAQTDEAIQRLHQVCLAQPDCLAAHAALASAYDEKGRPAKALAHLEAIGRSHPGEAPVLLGIGFCREKLDEPGPAAACYREAIEADGYLLAARERLAAIDVLGGDLDEAIVQYLALRDAEPQEIGYRAALAHVYLRAGYNEEAVDEFETAITMEPDNWALVDDEVEELVAQGQIGHAMDRLGSLMTQQGPFADLHVRLGDLCSRVGDDDGALKNYLLALDLQPSYLEATVKLGTHHLINGRWEEAAEAFHRAAELNDRLLMCYTGMGVAQLAMGARADAMNSFDLAATVEPNSTLLLAEMAKLQLRSVLAEEYADHFCAGDPTPPDDLDLTRNELLERQIRRHAEEVRRNGRNAELRYRYGALLRAQGRLSPALEQFREAVTLCPSYTKAWIKLGITQQDFGLVDQAIDSFEQAMKIDAEQVRRHYRLGLLYTNRRRFEKELRRLEAQAGRADCGRVRADLALAMQNMGLMDRVSATWRSLWQIHRARAG